MLLSFSAIDEISQVAKFATLFSGYHFSIHASILSYRPFALESAGMPVYCLFL